MTARRFAPRGRFVSVVAAVLAAAIALPGIARADGEAGIVIQNGDNVTTYCVAFQGDSISGDAALSAAGLSFGLVRGGALCSINDVGCFDAGSFQDCFCQCKGGADCTYWAFFEKPAGAASFLYSNNAVTGSRLRDGDMQAWKWGQGQPNAAPQPVNVDFANVCPARFQPTATPTQPPPTAAPTSPPPTATAGAATPSGTAITPGDPTPTTDAASPSVTVTVTQNPFTPLPTGAPSVSVTIAQASPSPSAGVPDTGAPGGADDDGGSNAGTLAAFGVVAAALVGAVGGAAWWRRRHGA